MPRPASNLKNIKGIAGNCSEADQLQLKIDDLETTLKNLQDQKEQALEREAQNQPDNKIVIEAPGASLHNQKKGGLKREAQEELDDKEVLGHSIKDEIDKPKAKKQRAKQSMDGTKDDDETTVEDDANDSEATKVGDATKVKGIEIVHVTQLCVVS